MDAVFKFLHSNLLTIFVLSSKGIQIATKICTFVGTRSLFYEKKTNMKRFSTDFSIHKMKRWMVQLFWTKYKKNSLVDMLHVDGSIIFYPIPQIRLQGLSNKLIFSNILKTNEKLQCTILFQILNNMFQGI